MYGMECLRVLLSQPGVCFLIIYFLQKKMFRADFALNVKSKEEDQLTITVG